MVDTWRHRIRILLCEVHGLSTDPTKRLCLIDLLFILIKRCSMLSVLIWPVFVSTHFFFLLQQTKSRGSKKGERMKNPELPATLFIAIQNFGK